MRPGLISVASLATVLALPAVGQEWSGYRVTGTVMSSRGNTAVIALPGEQSSAVVSMGDKLGSGTVVEISRRWVRIAYDDGELRLPLAQGDAVFVPGSQLAASQAVSPSPTAPLLRSENHDTIYHRVVEERSFAVALNRNAPQVRRDDSDPDPEESLAEILRMLELPAASRIVSVNDVPVDGPAETLARIREGFGNEHVNIMTLTLESSSGETERVYVQRETLGETLGG